MSFTLTTASATQRTEFSPQEEAVGERAKTLAEAMRVKAAVESMMSLMAVMADDNVSDVHLPYVLDSRTKKALGGARCVEIRGNQYSFSQDGEVKVYRVSNPTETKEVREHHGAITFVEERRSTLRRLPQLRPALVAYR